MAATWRSCKLGDAITLQRGFDLPKHKRESGMVPIVSSSGITGTHNMAKVSGPGVVTGRYGTLGKSYFIKEDFWPLNTTLFVRDFKGNDQRFISYLLQTLNFENQNVAGAVPGINRNFLHLLPVKIPTLEVQINIASTLSAYDDLIENNTRRIKILEEMAQSLYREWFINFRFPGHEKTKMVDSPLGKIPEGWEVKKLGDVMELAYGKALRADNRLPGDVPVYGSGGVVGCHNESLVEGPGVIIGRKGNVGSVYWSDMDFYPIDTVFYVNSEISLYYCFYNLQHQNFLNSDAAVPGLSRKSAYLLPLLIPSDNMFEQFEAFITPIFDQLKILRGLINNLHSTRDLLLPKLISGDLNE